MATQKAKQEAFWPERQNGLRSNMPSWCAAQQALGIPAISSLEDRRLQRPSQLDQQGDVSEDTNEQECYPSARTGCPRLRGRGLVICNRGTSPATTTGIA